ncbi:MAG: otsB [Ilumatobacteraceae bacterium]|nr:otsB [Ilumatobacteraceae bacterium]
MNKPAERGAGEGFDEPADIVEAILALPRPLLLATDVDGTLAPIAARPEQARLAPGALDVLLRLAARDDVELAVVSGRSLDELLHQFGLPPSLHLVGSHGAEMEHGAPLDDNETALLGGVTDALAEIAATAPGARVEHKPLAAALHVRGTTPDDATRTIAAARAMFGADSRVHVHEGHQVYEVAVRPATKATALAALRARLGPGAVAFLGDDRSDETAFVELGVDDVGVKVGSGPTAARYRLATPSDVVQVMQLLAPPD